MKNYSRETPESRARRLEGYRLKHARQKAAIAILPPRGDDDSPEEQERILREIAELSQQKRAMAMAGEA